MPRAGEVAGWGAMPGLHDADDRSTSAEDETRVMVERPNVDP